MKKEKFPPCFPTVEARFPGVGDIVAFIVLVMFCSICIVSLYIKTDLSRTEKVVNKAIVAVEARERLQGQIKRLEADKKIYVALCLKKENELMAKKDEEIAGIREALCYIKLWRNK